MAHAADAVAERGVRVERVSLGRWSLSTAFALLAGSHLRRRGLVYMSYPTEGYGKSLLPFLLALGARRSVVLHIHEYTSKNRYCRFLLRRFNRMRRIYFSNAPDHEQFIRDCGLADQAGRTEGWQVLPTPSNIPVTATREERRDGGPLRIVHFGQIRPLKGLETLAEAFRLLAFTPSIELTLVGGVPRGYEDYARGIAATFRQAGARVLLDLPVDRLSQALAESDIGVFWFPDGADERRGSLAAAMAHGILCITTHSQRTQAALRAATVGIDLDARADATCDSERIADAVRAVIGEGSTERLTAIAQAGQRLARSASFEGIARRLMDDEPTL